MRLALPAAAFLVAALLWSGLALGYGHAASPDVAVALFAGLLLPDWRGRALVVAALLLIRAGTSPFPGMAGLDERLRGGTVLLAPFLGTLLRAEPLWWRILGVVGLLDLAAAAFASLCWEAYAADFGYAVLTMVAMALILREGKR